MTWLSKAGNSLKKWVHKGSGTVASFSKKASGIAHSIGHGLDQFEKSSVGKAILDAVPEGHAIYDTVRGGAGLAEKGFKGSEKLSRGIGKLAKSKSLGQALKDGKKLYKETKSSFDEAVQEGSSLEKKRRKLPGTKSMKSRFKMG